MEQRRAVVMAKELSAELDGLLNEFMVSLSAPDADKELRQWLWDNKIGILRVMQAHALARRWGHRGALLTGSTEGVDRRKLLSMPQPKTHD